jgi:hypothetical protein
MGEILGLLRHAARERRTPAYRARRCTPRVPAQAAEVVICTLKRSATCLCITIIDEAAGFDHAGFLRIDRVRAFGLHGRGIALANLMNYDELTYRGRGNRVQAGVRIASGA